MPASRAVLAEIERRGLRHDKPHELGSPAAKDVEHPSEPCVPVNAEAQLDLDPIAPSHALPTSQAEETALEPERPKKRRGSTRQAD